MLQKVIKVGNSIGTIIPQLLNKDLGLKPGDQLQVERKGKQIIFSPIKKARKGLAPGVNAKFIKMVDEFMLEHEDALKELAKH